MFDRLVRIELVDLLDMDSKTTRCIELPRAVLALEMLRLLMLHQNYRQEYRLASKVEGYSRSVECAPFSSSNSRSQYQHHGLST